MFKKFLIFLLVVCSMGVLGLFFAPVSPVDLTLDIAPGSSVRAVSKQMSQKGVTSPWWLLEATARSMGIDKKIKSGLYVLKRSESTYSIWTALLLAKPDMADIKLIEGWTFKQIRGAVDSNPKIKHDTQNLPDSGIMQLLGAHNLAPEGRFFPDTYSIAIGSSDLLVYKAAFEKMAQISEKIWQTKPATTPLRSVNDLINLASIIEKETGLASERNLVASVFHNRLAIGMRLQTDPTVIYGMGEKYQGKIRRIDLETDTPYNTYTRAGLPPTPIAAPSEASLMVAMHPAQTPYFYFVAKGDGSGASFFSTTLTEHNRAVAQYLSNRRLSQ